MPHGLAPVAAALLVLAAQQPALAQEGGPDGDVTALVPLRVQPRISLTETLTDNVSLSSTDRRSELITQVSPGLRVVRDGGRVKGFADYALNALAYARGSRDATVQQALTSGATAELVEQHAFVDAAASISQQTISPLGVQTTDPTLASGNRTEVRTWQLAPRLQGRLGQGVQWLARTSYAASSSTSSTVSDSSTTQAVLQLNNASTGTRLGWTLEGLYDQRDFSLGRSTQSQRVRGLLDWRVDPELSLGVIGGYERNDMASTDLRGRRTHGWRATWMPSERTRVSGEQEQRFFGSAYNLAASHRTGSTLWSYTAARALSSGTGAGTTGQLPSNLALLLQRYAGQATSLAELQQLVLAGLGGRNPNGTELATFLAAAVTAVRSQELSVTWLSPRDTLTLLVQQSLSERVDSVSGAVDALSLAGNRVSQHGWGLNFSHRLTPISTVSLGWRESRGAGTTLSTRLRTATAQYSTLLAPRLSLSVLGRHARFESATSPYDESAIVAALGLTF